MSSKHSRTNAHMSSQRLWLHSQNLNKVKQMGSLCWERNMETDSNSKQNSFRNWPNNAESILVLYNGVALGILTTLKDRHILSSRNTTHNYLSNVFVDILLHCSILFVHWFFLSLIDFAYVCSRTVLLWGLYGCFLRVCLF